jgi:hypothetical protein
LIYDERAESIELAQCLTSVFARDKLTGTSRGLPFDVYSQLISKEFKSMGSRFLTLATDGQTAKKLLQAAEERFVGGTGYGFLLSPDSLSFAVDGSDE